MEEGELVHYPSVPNNLHPVDEKQTEISIGDGPLVTGASVFTANTAQTPSDNTDLQLKIQVLQSELEHFKSQVQEMETAQ